MTIYGKVKHEIVPSILPPGSERKKRSYHKRKPAPFSEFEQQQHEQANQAMSTIHSPC